MMGMDEENQGLYSQDTHQSVYRERLLEHLLIGELLKYAWLHCGASLEVSQPSIDRSGHDVVLEANGITRHVQLKASKVAAAASSQKVHVGLASKPSGCIVWVRFDPEDMRLESFLFFGGVPGESLKGLEDFKVAKHTKGNALGIKAERRNIRLVPKSQFRLISSIEELYVALFGIG
jgi:hypothetical protein